MIAYVTVGADDMALAKQFYSAFLPQLGFALSESAAGLSYSIPVRPDQSQEPVDFYVKPPFDGQPASVGNGSMTAFQATTQSEVRALHAAALAAGGRDEGAPGFRDAYSADFYVGYVRDPQGNKIALFCSVTVEPKV